MPVIDLDYIMKERGLKPEVLAPILCPENDHPKAALYRLRKTGSQMNEDQILRLATFLRCSTDELFNGGWKFKNLKDKNHTFIKITNDKTKYLAILDLEYGKTYLYADGNAVCETMLHSKTVTLSEYFKTLDRLIKKAHRK